MTFILFARDPVKWVRDRRRICGHEDRVSRAVPADEDRRVEKAVGARSLVRERTVQIG
jgi:hypothetical protein